MDEEIIKLLAREHLDKKWMTPFEIPQQRIYAGLNYKKNNLKGCSLFQVKQQLFYGMGSYVDSFLLIDHSTAVVAYAGTVSVLLNLIEDVHARY